MILDLLQATALLLALCLLQGGLARRCAHGGPAFAVGSGLIYGLADGLLRDLDICVAATAELAPMYAAACAGGATGSSGSKRACASPGRVSSGSYRS